MINFEDRDIKFDGLLEICIYYTLLQYTHSSVFEYTAEKKTINRVKNQMLVSVSTILF